MLKTSKDLLQAKIAAGGIGATQLSDVEAFIQNSRQFTTPLAQLGSMVLQSRGGSLERELSVVVNENQGSVKPAPSSGPVWAGAAGV